MDIRVGKVTHYYNHLCVAVLELDGEIKLGDTILFLGHTTEFTQEVTSMEINHHKIQIASPGMDVALKVDDEVRRGDLIYKVVETHNILSDPV